MEIEKVSDGHTRKMVVKGLIKSVEDSTLFKEALQSLLDTPTKTVSIHILDSFIVTSSIIGTMLKAVNVDKAKISLYAYQDDLYELLIQLNLLDALGVKKA